MPQNAVAPAEHYGAALARPVALAGATMGTTWSARLSATLSLSDTRIQAAVQAALDGVVAQMSHWETDTDLARFNRAPAGWHALPAALLHVLDYA